MINQEVCNDAIYKFGECCDVRFDLTKQEANEYCEEKTKLDEDYAYDWHYFGGRVRIMRLEKSLLNLGIKQLSIEKDLEKRVNKFAKLMLDKLIKKSRDGWNNWENCNPDVFRNGLRQHIEKGDPIDVANFAFFLSEMGESTAFNTGNR